MLKRTIRSLVAVLLGGVATLAAAQPAFAAVTVPAGQAGHACSGYTDLGDVQFQACAWASGGASPEVWFTGHFKNELPANLISPLKVKVGFYRTGTYYYCFDQLVVNSHGTVTATWDTCSIVRSPAAYQAKIEIEGGTGTAPTALSPTIVVK